MEIRREYKMKKRMILLASLLSLALAGNFLLSQVTRGGIIGTVTDSEGNPLPGVAVQGVSPSLVGQATAVTDEMGRYRLLSLPPGNYKITFSLPGFKSLLQENIVLRIEQTLASNVLIEM